MELTCNGQSGHGSSPLENTCGEKVRYLLDKFMDYRRNEINRVMGNVNLGDVTGVNLTMINGGIQTNVVPAEIKIVFDIRLAVDVDPDDFTSQAKKENLCVIAYSQSSLLYFRSNNGVKKLEEI